MNILYINDIIITFSKEENDKINSKCEEFVKAMSGKNQSAEYYEKHRNAQKEKIFNDIFLGKKAEFIAAQALFQYGLPLLEPDLEIRKGKAKKWKCDLQYDNIDIHVKSCNKKTLDFCKDYSWTFQNANKDICGGKDTLLKNNQNKQLVILVYLENMMYNIGVVKAIVEFSKIEPLLKDPIKKLFIGLKKCIYYKDLEKLNELQRST
jgi:hypothetical protein